MKDFITHEPALALKELGFDEPCLGYYLCRNSAFGIDDLLITTEWIDLLPYDSSSCKAPTYSQAFRWFKEKRGIFVSIVPNRHGSLDSFIGWIYVPLNGSTKDINVGDYKIGFNTPEEAELACLNKLIEITRTK
jgi:hypothetical protein